LAFDTARTLERVASLAARAGDSGAKLILFPEAFVGGYPKGLDFGTRVGGRTPEGRAWFRRYFDGAIDVPGPETDRLGEIAERHSAWLVIGVIERDRGTLYCTALFFSPAGALVAKHRKLMPTAMERIIWGFGDGSTLPMLETPVGKIGAVICWENYMPLLRMAMYSKGVQIYCAPTVDDRETWSVSMRHIAVEGRCFVLSACQFAQRADYPDDYPADPVHTGEILIRGGSSIFAPLGRVLAGPVYDREEVLTAEINLDEIAEGKFDLDVAGHYARPDVFQLTVNETCTDVDFKKSR
jgi:nitrilase